MSHPTIPNSLYSVDRPVWAQQVFNAVGLDVVRGCISDDVAEKYLRMASWDLKGVDNVACNELRRSIRIRNNG